MRGGKDTLSRMWLVVRCSVIGNIIGIIPSIGGDTASFFAYGHAKQSEKNGHLSGTGVVEGVIAPQSAINAKGGDVLFPMVRGGQMAGNDDALPSIIESQGMKKSSGETGRLIQKIYEVDPLVCPK